MLFTDFDFDSRILKSLRHLGFEETTEIQAKAMPEAMAGRDLLASSKTGSGKTLAYVLPALHRTFKVKPLSNRDPRVLILVPTRELAKQVFAQVRLMLAGSRLTSSLLLGGENFNDQIKALQKNPHFLIATPGRLVDHLKQRNLYLEGLELLILDEADRMLDLGFAEQLRFIDDAANHRLRQTLFFSATLDNTEVNEIAQLLLKEPTRVSVGDAIDEHTDIRQQFYLCDHLDHKETLLMHVLKNESIKQAIVFTATKLDTVRLSDKIAALGFTTQALNGDLSQSARNKVMDSFTRGHFTVLVSTDVASRGLDIANISHVINFDIPKQSEEYVHRTGRTGRAGFKGDAISFVGPKDWHNFKALEAYLKRECPISSINGLEAKFKGLAPKVVRLKSSQVKDKGKLKAPVQRKKKGINTKVFDASKQEGFDAFRLPSKKAGIPIDNDSED